MKPRVLIAVPVSADGRPSCETAEAVGNLRGTYPERFVELRVRDIGSTFLVREAIADWVRADQRFTHTLLVDSDIKFVPEQAMALLAAEKDIVAGVYVTKDALPTPVTYYDGQDGLMRPMLGRSIMEVDKIGLGFCLIHRRVIDKTPKPLFAHVAEDVHFCRQVRAAGFRIWCDFRVQVGHLGKRVFTVEDAEATAQRLGLEPGVTPADAEVLMSGDEVRAVEMRGRR